MAVGLTLMNEFFGGPVDILLIMKRFRHERGSASVHSKDDETLAHSECRASSTQFLDHFG